MCGIVGIVNRHDPANVQLLVTMRDILEHRGPNDAGVWRSEDGRVGLASRRLAILDLSTAARMPMQDGQNWITYNGEIYNYLELKAELVERGYDFRTTSDTEVLLKAYREWGTDCLQYLNGMFAFAIWDGTRRRLFAARDRFGVKPFYYFFDGATFIFASEIKALLLHPAVPRKPNPNMVYDFLVFKATDHTEETFFDRIRQLLPSHYLILDGDGNLVKSRWWDAAASPEINVDSVEEDRYIEQFQTLFEDAIRLRLRTDVPIGTCLSGGLDSSSIVTVANRLMFEELALDRCLVGEHQKTFSSCFEDNRFDERPFINHVLQATGAESYQIFPDGKALWEEVPKMIWHMDEPFRSTNQYAEWNVMKRVAQSGVTVTLDGQGGDELLAGYPGYYGVWLTTLVRQGHWRRAVYEAWAIRRLGGRVRRTRDLLLRTTYGVLPLALKATLRHLTASWLNSVYPEGHSLKILQPAFRRQFAEHHREWLYRHNQNMQNFPQRLHDDVFHYSLPNILRYEDRNSMAFSIESRTPFLDYRLVELVMAMPASMKMRDGWTKWVLRQAMEGTLPPAVQWRSDKKGYVTPEVIWLRQGETQIRNLFSGSVLSAEFIDPNKVRNNVGLFLAGKVESASTTEIWRWIILELWMQCFFNDKSPEGFGRSLTAE